MKKLFLLALMALSISAIAEEKLENYNKEHDLYNHEVCEIKDLNMKTKFREFDSSTTINKEKLEEKCKITVSADVPFLKTKMEMTCLLTERQHELYVKLNEIKDRMFFANKTEQESLEEIKKVDGYREIIHALQDKEICEVEFISYDEKTTE